MSSLVFIGLYAGTASGAILLFFSHVAPWFGAGNFIKDTDQPAAFGRALSRREAHVLGVLIHLIVSALFGFIFGAAVASGLASFSIVPILIWSLFVTFFMGVVIMPLEGHGFFGIKHDAWFAIDVLITNFLWGFMYLGLVKLWMA